MGGRKRDIWFYGILFNVLRLTGVLPVTRNTHKNLHLHMCGPRKDCFSLSRWAQLMTAWGLVVVAVSAWGLAPSQDLLLSPYICTWLQSIFSAFASLLLTLFRQPDKLIECASTACKIYTIPPNNFKPFPLFFFLLSLVYPFITVIYLFIFVCFKPMSVGYIFYIFKYNYLYTPIAAVEVVVSTFCFIARRSFCDVNQRLRLLQKSKFKTKSVPSFKLLLENYIAVGKFVKIFAEYFGPHFLNTFASFITRMIIYAIVFIKLVKENRYTEMLSYGVHALYLTFRLFFVCYCCQKVKEEFSEAVVIIRRIRILWVDKISEEEEMLLDTYEELMESINVEFTACGLFPVNMQQVLSVLGLIITYGLVALQSK